MEENTMNKITINKTCPLLNRKCLKEECAIFHDHFKNCQINVLALNLWILSETNKKNGKNSSNTYHKSLNDAFNDEGGSNP
jgi:hypothetical protein